jgi:hypothetical protein
MNPTNVILEAQNTVNQAIENQKKHERKLWFQKNWWWIAGSVVVLGAASYVAYKKLKK